MGMKTAIAIILAIALVTLIAPRAQGKDVIEQLIRRLNEMTPEQAVAMKYGWEIPGHHVYCAGSLPIRRFEVPVLDQPPPEVAAAGASQAMAGVGSSESGFSRTSRRGRSLPPRMAKC